MLTGGVVATARELGGTHRRSCPHHGSARCHLSARSPGACLPSASVNLGSVGGTPAPPSRGDLAGSFAARLGAFLPPLPVRSGTTICSKTFVLSRPPRSRQWKSFAAMFSGLAQWLRGVFDFLGLFPRDAKLCFLGLDNAGKTTLLQMLKENRVSISKPTLYPQNEELLIRNIRFRTFDLGGHETARRIWRDYYATVNGILFVVDAADRTRFEEARQSCTSGGSEVVDCYTSWVCLVSRVVQIRALGGRFRPNFAPLPGHWPIFPSPLARVPNGYRRCPDYSDWMGWSRGGRQLASFDGPLHEPPPPRFRAPSPHCAMQVAPIFVRIRARNGFFVANRPFLARILTRIGTTCMARRDGVDSGGLVALRLRSIDMAQTCNGGCGQEGEANLPLGARVLTPAPGRYSSSFLPRRGDSAARSECCTTNAVSRCERAGVPSHARARECRGPHEGHTGAGCAARAAARPNSHLRGTRPWSLVPVRHAYAPPP